MKLIERKKELKQKLKKIKHNYKPNTLKNRKQ